MKKIFKLTKKVLPQHTDHAGVLWHGKYLNWLEESRINALSISGMEYSFLSQQGYEMPVINLNITYLLPIFHGEDILLQSNFSKDKGPRWRCDTNFYSEGKLKTKSEVSLVIVDRVSHKIVRKYPEYLEESLNKLLKY